jgi:hypothetical protein
VSNLVRVLFVFLLGWMAASVNAQAVAYTPTQITQIVTTSFQKDDFATLDKMATQFRTTKSRSSSGSWNLAIFYSNFRDAMYEGRRQNSDAQWQQIEGRIARWAATAPNSASAPIFLAWAQLRHGWSFRGNGSANTVTKEGWTQFSRYVSMSADTLEKHKRVSSVDPEWYVMMLTLAKHRKLKDGEYALLYEEALKAEPLYHDTYKVVAQAVSPRWGGSVAQVSALAADAVKRTNAAEGRALYARIFWSVSDDDSGILGQIVSTGGWALMKSGFEDMIKQYPDAWNKNAYARFACQSGDVDLFIQLARQLGGKPEPDAWPGNIFKQCKDYAAELRPVSPI